MQEREQIVLSTFQQRIRVFFVVNILRVCLINGENKFLQLHGFIWKKNYKEINQMFC